jgi:diguanylate cyclase (GGDEF)-like protein
MATAGQGRLPRPEVGGTATKARAAAVTDLARFALDHRDLPSLMRAGVEVVQRVLGVEAAQAFELLGGNGMLAAWAAAGEGAPAAKLSLARQAAAALGAPGTVALDVAADPLHTAAGVHAGLATVVPGPEGHVFGVLCAQSHHTRTFDVDDAHFLESVASVLGLGVEHAAARDRVAWVEGHDPLTRLPNRRELVAAIGATCASGRRDLAVVSVVLDLFERLLHDLGGAAADEVLRAVARRLCRSNRGDALVARVGQHRFTLLVPGIASEAEAAELGANFAAVLAQPLRPRPGTPLVSITASIGIATATDHDVPEALVAAADLAVERARELGRNRWFVFDDALRVAARDVAKLEHALREGIGRGELRLHYQPIVDLVTGALHGAEALVRWQHPDQGLLAPDRFIPLAERTGLVVPLGAWVLEEAGRQLAEWATRGLHMPELSVNLSPRQLLEGDIVAVVRRVVDGHGIDPRVLCLEVTENALVEEPARAADALHALTELGVRISIDDFGTGYSSLGQLKRYPLADILKIDRSFVDGVGRDPTDDVIVAAIVGLARGWSAEVVAEGIEQSKQCERLVALGVGFGQGYLWSRPVPADAFEALVAARPA